LALVGDAQGVHGVFGVIAMLGRELPGTGGVSRADQPAPLRVNVAQECASRASRDERRCERLEFLSEAISMQDMLALERPLAACGRPNAQTGAVPRCTAAARRRRPSRRGRRSRIRQAVHSRAHQSTQNAASPSDRLCYLSIWLLAVRDAHRPSVCPDGTPRRSAEAHVSRRNVDCYRPGRQFRLS
jgi:hypothetical protein